MKGVVFNVVEEVVVDMYDADTWEDILDAVELDGAYASLGSYPDEHLLAIVGEAARMLELDVPTVLKTVGRAAFAGLSGRHSQFELDGMGFCDFVQHVETYIHPEVRKLYADATVPNFDFETLDDGNLRMTYTSPRNLPDLAEGLLMGAADAFGETLAVERPGIDAGEHSTVFDLVIG